VPEPEGEFARDGAMEEAATLAAGLVWVLVIESERDGPAVSEPLTFVVITIVPVICGWMLQWYP
jgi:hypothetical protein